MARTILFIHPNGKSREIKVGFCWFGFALPIIWALSEGLWRQFAFSLLGWLGLRHAQDVGAALGHAEYGLLSFLAYPAVMIAFGIYGKKWLISDMLANGYVKRWDGTSESA